MTEREINYLVGEFKKIDNKIIEIDKRIDKLSRRKTINISNETTIFLIYGAVTIIILIITYLKIGG